MSAVVRAEVTRGFQDTDTTGVLSATAVQTLVYDMEKGTADRFFSGKISRKHEQRILLISVVRLRCVVLCLYDCVQDMRAVN